jgi:hypothetical protein
MKQLVIIAICTGATLCAQSTGPVAVTPEPASIGLMAVGFAAIGYGAWRQKRKK